MKRKKSHPPPTSKLDPFAFMHQPHDKYARFVLQNRAVALEIIQFGLAPEICAMIDLDSLELSEDSFVDAKLQSQFSDVCYNGQTKEGEPIRISIIFEHKSDKDGSALEQLNRYIYSTWSNDRKQGRALSLAIPILLYHGKEPISKETPAVLFPKAPPDLLPFVPAFDYVLLDVCRLPDELLENLRFLLLRNILLALKYSRDENYLRQNWKKIIIFASELRNTGSHLELFQATIIYMSRVSNIFNENIIEMDNVLSSAEQLVVKPHVIKLYEDAMEKGIQKGVRQGLQQGVQEGIVKVLSAFIKKNPDWTDKQIAPSFEVSEELVRQVRATIQAKRKKG
jgi:predicted transposase/invertase (TIGR01784 family)